MTLNAQLPSTRDRFLGCLLGGAVGDALGANAEFMLLEEIEGCFGDGGIKDFAPAYGRLGAITDDTQMSLFTAEGLIMGRVRYHDRGIASVRGMVGLAYQRWLATQEGPKSANHRADEDGWLIGNEDLWNLRAPGNSCLTALRTGKLGPTDEPINMSKGCGAVMRVAPV